MGKLPDSRVFSLKMKLVLSKTEASDETSKTVLSEKEKYQILSASCLTAFVHTAFRGKSSRKPFCRPTGKSILRQEKPCLHIRFDTLLLFSHRAGQMLFSLPGNKAFLSPYTGMTWICPSVQSALLQI